LEMRTAGRSLFRECANGSPKLQCSFAFSDSDPHRKYNTYGRSAQPRRRSFGFRSKGMTEAREVDFYFCAAVLGPVLVSLENELCVKHGRVRNRFQSVWMVVSVQGLVWVELCPLSKCVEARRKKDHH